MNSRISLFILLCLLSSVSQAGGEEAFPKVMFASAFGSLLAGNGDGFPEVQSADLGLQIRFVERTTENELIFDYKSNTGNERVRSTEEFLEEHMPDHLEALERSFHNEGSWQEI